MVPLEALTRRNLLTARGLIQFATSLPGALLLTGFLMERFGILGFVERAALAFQRVSADFWKVVFWIVPFRIDYDPNILSTYVLLLVPLVVDLARGHLFRERTRQDAYFYLAGLVAVAAIVIGYDAWGFIADIYIVVGGILLTVLIFAAMYLPFYLLAVAMMGHFAASVLFSIAGYLFLAVWVILWFFDVSLIAMIEGSFLPKWLSNILVGVLEAYSFETMWSFLFAIFTLIVLLAAPLTRAPLFLVAWVGVFFAANWFDAEIRPKLDDYFDGLEDTCAAHCRDAGNALV